ncbi:MAG: TetR/AcrR family transcriptional regulator [Deltaproteobacteria bacterium]|nr:TetR/AcrR family transcriptional regulator [Deltaproteobacteria bacterium]
MLREDRKRQILDCAKKVFASKGYHATGVADIIDACGIARGTFYLYFESKRRVFEALLDEFLELLESRVHRIDETAGLPAIRTQLRANVMRVLGAFAENPELSQMVLNEAVGLDKGFDEKLAEFYGGLIDLIDLSLVLGQQVGIVRPLDTRVIAACILGSIKEIVLRVLHGRFERLSDLDAIVDEILSYHLRALFVRDLLDA